MKILEIIKQSEYSGVLFGLSNKILYHEGRSTHQGAVLGRTTQLFLDRQKFLKLSGRNNKNYNFSNSVGHTYEDILEFWTSFIITNDLIESDWISIITPILKIKLIIATPDMVNSGSFDWTKIKWMDLKFISQLSSDVIFLNKHFFFQYLFATKRTKFA